MNNSNPKSYTGMIIFLFALAGFAMINYSIFINYKQDILEERINFVSDHAPILKKANNQTFYAILENVKYSMSYQEKIDQLTRDIELISSLSSMPKPVRSEIIFGLYQRNSHKDGQKIQGDKFLADLVSPRYYDQLKNYSTIKLEKDFMNSTDQFFLGSVSDIFLQPFRIYTSQKGFNFYDHLNYQPTDIAWTKMKFNSVQSSDNTFFFNPKEVGEYLIDVEIKQLSANGDQKTYVFKKRIEVYP